MVPREQPVLGAQAASPQALPCALVAAIIQLADAVFSASSQNPPRTSTLGCGASLLTARALNSDVTERPPMSFMAEGEGGQGLPYRPR